MLLLLENEINTAINLFMDFEPKKNPSANAMPTSEIDDLVSFILKFDSASSINEGNNPALLSGFQTIPVNRMDEQSKQLSLAVESSFRFIKMESTFEFENITVSSGEDVNIRPVAEILISKIEDFQKQGKELEAIKEAHKLFENLLSKSSFNLADQVLIQGLNKGFQLSILIAFLASTSSFKENLKNRQTVFEKAQAIAIEKIGEGRLNSSVFNLLK